MYESLNRHCKDFHLYVFAFNDECFSVLKSLYLANMTVISLPEFEDEELLKVKPTRSRGEYCWTCSSSTILYVLDNYDVDHCTYIDADLYFFASPQILLDEMDESESVLITHTVIRLNMIKVKKQEYIVFNLFILGIINKGVKF